MSTLKKWLNFYINLNDINITCHYSYTRSFIHSFLCSFIHSRNIFEGLKLLKFWDTIVEKIKSPWNSCFMQVRRRRRNKQDRHHI